MNRALKVYLSQLIQCVREWRATYGNITLDELVEILEAKLKD